MHAAAIGEGRDAIVRPWLLDAKSACGRQGIYSCRLWRKLDAALQLGLRTCRIYRFFWFADLLCDGGTPARKAGETVLNTESGDKSVVSQTARTKEEGPALAGPLFQSATGSTAS